MAHRLKKAQHTITRNDRIYKLAYQSYKWIIIIPFVFLNTLINGLIAIFTGFFFNQEAVNRIAVIWGKLCCAIVPIGVCVTGKTNYSTYRSYVIVSNHQSVADIPVLHGHLGLNIKWIMKKELGKIPVFGTACRQLGCITIDRTKHRDALRSIEQAKKNLSDKACVLFFAEGTRSRDGKVMPFKKGAFKFALDTGLPILPVTVKNSIDIVPSDSLDITPGTVEIIVHPPVLISERRHLTGVMKQTRKTISDAL